MAKIISRRFIFLTLAMLAIAFGALSVLNKPDFFNDVFPQLFWLTIGTIATTFVLETLLQQDTENRRREEDSFAFRTFAASMTESLLEISRSHGSNTNLIDTALFDKEGFALAVRDACQVVIASKEIDMEAYNRQYLNFENGIRDLSRNYIRLFASSQKDMAQTYRQLQKLANRWVYRYELTSSFRENTNLETDKEIRSQREKETIRAIEDAKMVIRDTAVCLTDLAQRVAKYRGMPPPP